MTIVLAYSAIVLPFLAMLVGMVIVAYASNALRVAVKGEYPYRALLATAGLAIISTTKWRTRVRPNHIESVAAFGRRMRIAVGLLAIPFLEAVLLALLA
jgi:hypothetical protein